MNADWTTDPPTSRRHALNTIRMLMEFWGLTPQDLEHALAEAPGGQEPAVAAPAVKYRHPASGATWDGRGSQPEWLREALTREGYTVAELRVAVAEAPADPA